MGNMTNFNTPKGVAQIMQSRLKLKSVNLRPANGALKC